MSGDTFVVGDRLVVDERALCEVGGGNDNAAGALAVRSAGDVMGCIGRLEDRYGLDGHRRFGKQVEEPRKLRFHLGDVVAEIVEDLFRGGRSVFGIGFEGSPERGKIGKALFFGDHHHLGLDAVNLAEAELMYLVGRHVRGGPAVNVILVAFLALWQRGDSEGSTALGSVFRAHECGEGLVRRDDVGVDGIGDLPGQALLVFGGDERRIFFRREEKGIGVNDALALEGKLFQKEFHRHQLVLHAGAKNFGSLAEHAWDLVQTRDVVFIVLDGIQRDGKWQVREAGMDAVHLVDWHLVLFEIEVGDALLENTDHEVVGELILVGETGSRDGFQPRKEIHVGLMAPGDGVE